MNTHEQINDMLVDYVLGELSDQQSSQVEAHLTECQDCDGQAKRLKTLLESTEQMSDLSAGRQMCDSAKKALFETIVNEEMKEPTTRPTIDLVFTWRTIMKSRITKVAAAAVIIIAVLIGLDFLGGPDMANVAWAEVTRRVGQADYLHCYYFKGRGDTFKRHFEAWYAHGKLVMCGDKGGMTYDDGQTQQTFDEQGRRTVIEPSFFAEGQTFCEVFTAGLLSDKNEQFNRQVPTNVGDDFLIYEFDPPPDEGDYLESVFITVGKNSLLPVQIKIYEKSGDYDLMMFDYEAPEKPAEFFEPPGVDAPHGKDEVLLDGEEVVLDIEGAPGIKQAIVRLHDMYNGSVDQLPSAYRQKVHHRFPKTYKKKGGPVFRLDVTFVTDEGYLSQINDLIVLWLNEAQQCGVGASGGGGLDGWPDGKYRNIRFSPLLKPTDREDTYIVEMRCWLRTK